ncbi:zincin [Aspergillus ellipticus CBS 707.79]|uniref:Disintegrin and metalloproteinase domain-containing protein B n=1 Tax=Aspergillus ellipticus CBS 707.79 TaxID=1448320 RepID=A0A319DSK9_9EURO|nr:zincin [Aspergillus ellipticus CBS 707.79]
MRLYPFVSYLASSLFLLGYHATAHSVSTKASNHTIQLDNPIIHTRSHRVKSLQAFNLTFQLHGHNRDLRLQLVPNHDILPGNSQTQYLGTNGEARRSEPITTAQYRVFKGSVWARGSRQEKEVGWARIYLVEDGHSPLFQGTFTVFGERHHVKLQSNTKMVAYPDSSGPHGSISKLHLPVISTPWNLHQRQNSPSYSDLVNNIGNTAGCPNTRRVALIGLATDYSYTASFDSSEDIRRELISMVNTASEVYEQTFDIALGIRNLTISDRTCPSSSSDSVPWNVACSTGNIDWRLEQFSSWRGAQDDTNAYWTLMTDCPTNGVVGVSYVGGLCNSDSGVNVVARTSNQWQVFAHESGHTFGAVHDCESRTCSSSDRQCCPLSSSTCDANAEYLMNPSSSPSETSFSPCSIGNICSMMGSGRERTSCLVSNSGNVPTITAGECGNGIVEAGEDCDCGGDCADNRCCDPDTCQFINGAVCDDTAGSCCQDCQFASSSTVCRSSTGTCDVEETCTGNSSSCPTDRHAPDGQSCGNTSSLFCASGECTNRDQQCRGLFNDNSTAISSCDTDSCSLVCSADYYGSGSYCMTTGQNVLDGTPCQGGLCRNE